MALVDYGDSDSDSIDAPVQVAGVQTVSINAAPAVSTQDVEEQRVILSRDRSGALIRNLPLSQIERAVQGPANPYGNNGGVRRNVLTGQAEEAALENATFARDLRAHGDVMHRAVHATGQDEHVGRREMRRRLKRKREGAGDAGEVDGFKGPWARYSNERPPIDYDSDASSVEEQDATALSLSDKAKSLPSARPSKATETTTFHGDSLRDYQGRTYMSVPRDLDIDLTRPPGEAECFMPKRILHTWKAHHKAISALRFFPNSGHLLLSASMDSRILLFDAHHERKLLREYNGHSKAVRDVCFNRDGKRFLSAGFDAQMKLWDTETGQCISRFSTGKIPNCIKINPDLDKQEEFLTGMSDRKIVQFDMRSGDVVQEYDHHLGAVNTVTFIDENRRFATTSDDKTLRAWEYGIPVPIKLIADPSMHAMPSVAAHPSGKYIAAQSLDNTILVYSAGEKIKLQRRKLFKGHGCAGYGIEVGFSPDGKYLTSGDAGGHAVFWDWKTSQMVGKFAAHKGPMTRVAWNPQETSKVATAGMDGVIHYWD